MTFKVCSLTWDASTANVGGAGTRSAANIRDMLHFGGISDVDVWSVHTRSMPSSNDFIAYRFKCILWSDAVREIGQFDFVYVTSMFVYRDVVVSRVMEVLKSCKQFCFIVHDEAEIHETYFDFVQQIMQLPNLRFVQYITPGIQARFEEFYDVEDNHKTFVQLCYPPKLEASIKEPKEDKIVTACRMASRKKTMYLARIAPYLPVNVEIWGAEPRGHYELSLSEEPYFEVIYHGPFDDHPSKKALFTWCMFLINRGKKITSIPRIELSALEALSHCSFPLLCRESTPSWMVDSYPGTVDMLGSRGLLKKSLSTEEKADAFMETIDSLRSLDVKETCSWILQELYRVNRYYENVEEICDFMRSY
ncbi:MAG: hypothetical protein MJA83_03340 [Gammaproteobacteria bacterium]|nr:hypothetical protein [Gammaproteobacteria bacterium]